MKKIDISKTFAERNYSLLKQGRRSIDYLDTSDEEVLFFKIERIWETDNNNQGLRSVKKNIATSFFKYFLDGCRLTYKIADLETGDGKIMPVVAGQIAVGISERNNKKLKIYKKENLNILLIYDRIDKDDFEHIKTNIEQKSLEKFPIKVGKYKCKLNENEKPMDRAIAKIQDTMQEFEIKLLEDAVKADKLQTNAMLIKDGSLQYADTKLDPRLFLNVIGVSKTFNAHLQGVLNKEKNEISTILRKLEYGQRTPVYKYHEAQSKRLPIGAWYLRIREKGKTKDFLDGIIKIEKVAINNEVEDGFETGLVDNISCSLLLETSVTCHGSDTRWASHLYPIYLTERALKASFIGNEAFLHIF